MIALEWAYQMDAVASALGHQRKQGSECGCCWGRGRFETNDGGERLCESCRGTGESVTETTEKEVAV